VIVVQYIGSATYHYDFVTVRGRDRSQVTHISCKIFAKLTYLPPVTRDLTGRCYAESVGCGAIISTCCVVQN
jgi:hypothetical protein